MPLRKVKVQVPRYTVRFGKTAVMIEDYANELAEAGMQVGFIPVGDRAYVVGIKPEVIEKEVEMTEEQAAAYDQQVAMFEGVGRRQVVEEDRGIPQVEYEGIPLDQAQAEAEGRDDVA